MARTEVLLAASPITINDNTKHVLATVNLEDKGRPDRIAIRVDTITEGGAGATFTTWLETRPDDSYQGGSRDGFLIEISGFENGGHVTATGKSMAYDVAGYFEILPSVIPSGNEARISYQGAGASAPNYHIVTLELIGIWLS